MSSERWALDSGMFHLRCSAKVVARPAHLSATKNTGECALEKFASFSIDSVLQRGGAKKHAQSISHAFAVKMVGGGTASASCILADKAPSEDQFRKVLSAVKKPGGTSSVANVGGAEKIKRMVWCLAEGRRDLIRSKLSVASTIAIHQDKGKSRLHVRATSCSSTLQQSGTVLGIQKMTGGHREIIDTTDSILKKFCTPNYGRPMASRERCKSPSAREPALDTTLYDRIRSKVELWNTDAASDCSLAGKLLHSDAVKSKETMTDIGKVLFENLRAVNWDCSHASRRMTSRPWQCDSYIRETMWIVLFKKKSIIKMIQNSQEFRQMLLANLKDLKNRVGDTVVDMCFAGHRYDSTTKPTGRAARWMYALIRTAIQIIRLRPGTEDAQAAHFFWTR